MSLRETVEIEASPEQVWNLLTDPRNMPRWNAKCVRSGPVALPLCEGARFHTSFRLRGPEQAMECEVVALRELEELVLRYHDSFRQGARVDERFELAPYGSGCRLTQTVDLSRSRLPLLARWFIAFLGKFGKKSGESPLDGLKRLAEAPTGT